MIELHVQRIQLMKTMQYLLMFLMAIINKSNTQSDIDLITELYRDGGKWVLAAAGTNAVDAPPPSKSCVEITVEQTNRKSDCIFNTLDHTIHRVKMLKFVGVDEENNTEIYTLGPVHQWLDNTLATPGKQTLSFNSMTKSAMCWHPETFRFRSYTFTATVVAQDPFLKNPKQSYFIYLVGVNCRMPRSEIHSAILIKEKTTQWEVDNMIDKLERMFKNQFPPLKVKCATDYYP